MITNDAITRLDYIEKELITPPLNGLILPGITRDSILALARQWGQFKVTEGTFNMPRVCELLNQGRVSICLSKLKI